VQDRLGMRGGANMSGCAGVGGGATSDTIQLTSSRPVANMCSFPLSHVCLV